jgi:hypothetical protein
LNPLKPEEVIMKRLLISAVALTAVTAVLSGVPAELTAADRGDAARDRAGAARDHASAARDAARDRANAARDVANAARDAARDRADSARDVASAARDAARDRASSARDVASAARDAARDRANSARDVASAAREAARDRVSTARDQARDGDGEDDRRVIEVVEREVFISANGDRSYPSLGAWIEDLQRSWSGTGSERPDGESSAETSVAIGNAVSKQTVTTSSPGGETSISLSTTVRATEDGRSVTQVERADVTTE